MISRPAVAEFKHKVALLPQYAVNFFSKSLVRGPVVIQPDFKAAVTSAIILSSIRGGENGIMMFYLIYENYIVLRYKRKRQRK
jgi:hypothetical protein